jgi:hypothetical protein
MPAVQWIEARLLVARRLDLTAGCWPEGADRWVLVTLGAGRSARESCSLDPAAINHDPTYRSTILFASLMYLFAILCRIGMAPEDVRSTITLEDKRQ